MMNEYIKELLNLKTDIEIKTNEAIKKTTPTKYELLDKAIEKINNYYDTLLDDIKGHRFEFEIELENRKYLIKLYSDCPISREKDYEPSRFAVIKLAAYDEYDNFILNKDVYGPITTNYYKKCYAENSYYVYFLKYKDSKTDKYKYYENIIELVSKYHDEIQKAFKKHVEQKTTESNMNNAEALSKRANFINTLENFINS